MTTGPRTILAFDFGTKRIGVAVGQELTKTASALVTLSCSSKHIDWASIDRLVADWQPQAFVVGLPLNADGTEHAITRAAKQFGDALQKRYNLAVYWQDERLTSVEAERMIATSQSVSKSRPGQKRVKHAHPRDKGAVDRVAAKLILESWFNRQ